jgi:hypothetical protein
MNLIERFNRKIAFLRYNKSKNGLYKRKLDTEDLLKEIHDEKFRAMNWPNNLDIAFSISLDDACLYDGKNNSLDFGGNVNGKTFNTFCRLYEMFDFFKPTIFFIPNPKFSQDGLTSKVISENYSVEHKASHPFIIKLKELYAENKVEIALHGLHHTQNKYKNYLPFAEFEFLNKKDCKIKIAEAIRIMDSIDLPVNAFKPPAWAIGKYPFENFLLALEQFKFNYCCLSSPNSGLNSFNQGTSHIYPEKIGHLINIPQNINLTLSLSELKKIIDKIIEKKGLINIQLHFNSESEYLNDNFSDANIAKLRMIIDYIYSKVNGKIWYATLNEIALHFSSSRL